jgi:hypothetical protein
MLKYVGEAIVYPIVYLVVVHSHFALFFLVDPSRPVPYRTMVCPTCPRARQGSDVLAVSPVNGGDE